MRHFGVAYRVTSRDEAEAELRRIAAEKRLAPIIELRAIKVLYEAGKTQEQIAELAMVSQPYVSRALARVRHDPRAVDVTAAEIVLRRAAGQITTGQMTRTLKSFPGVKGGVRGHDGYAPGTFDDLIALRSEGFLTKSEYRSVLKAAKARA